MGKMDVLIAEVKTVLVVIGAAIVAVLSPVASALTVLIVLMALDLASGLVANGKRHKLDPAVGWGGWKRKANTLLVVVALAVLQQIGAREGLPSIPAAQAVCGGFAVLEMTSIIRNAILSGVRIPKIMRSAFAKLEEEILGSEPASEPKKATNG